MENEKNEEIVIKRVGDVKTLETSVKTRTEEIKKMEKNEKVETRNFQQPKAQIRLKSKIAAGILALLLGPLGVHKFYLGKIIQGILYILFIWTMIPSIIAIIEGVILLTMDQREFDIKYNNGLRSEPKYGFNSADEILKFKTLLDNGIITQEEFDRKKQELL